MKINRNFQELEYRSLIIGLILSCITGILLLIVGRDTVISEIDQGLILILGMTTIAALSAFEQFRRNQKTCLRFLKRDSNF